LPLATVTALALQLATGLKNCKVKSGKGDEGKRVSPHVLCSRGESRSTSAQGAAGCPMKEAAEKSLAPWHPQADLGKPAGCPPTPTAHLPSATSLSKVLTSSDETRELTVSTPMLTSNPRPSWAHSHCLLTS